MKHVSILKFIIILWQLFVYEQICAQIQLPYYQSFDSVECIGWNHYAIRGTDQWQRGVPSGTYLKMSMSSPNVWGTNLTGITDANSLMVLETPYFDFSDSSKEYILSFSQQYSLTTSHGVNVEYSTDSGISWFLLNGSASQKYDWYNTTSIAGLDNQSGWNGFISTYFSKPMHSLMVVQGKSCVKFRFKYGSLSNPSEGWTIDDFAIYENVPNIRASVGTTYNASKNFITFDVVSNLYYEGFNKSSFNNVTKYYFSNDLVLDSADMYLGSKTSIINNSVYGWSSTFNMPSGIHARDYYILYTHDFNGSLMEGNENDNISYCKLHIDTTYNVPEIKLNFEDSIQLWKPSGNPLFWVNGKSNIHQIEGSHSGYKSWFINNPLISSVNAQYQMLESPYLDLSSVNDNVMCFWYKTKHSANGQATNVFRIDLSLTNSLPQYNQFIQIPSTRLNGWDCMCQSLSNLNGKNNAKIRINYNGSSSNYSFENNINIDDLYIGQPKPDLSIENKGILNSISNENNDSIYYQIFNGGYKSIMSAVTNFYWSTDTILDTQDIFISSINETHLDSLMFYKRGFHYTKPTQDTGTFYIFYKLDANNIIDEMWEENNIGYYTLKQSNVKTAPYFNDFETEIEGWWHHSTIGNDDWKWGMPNGNKLNTVFSGTNVFSTTKNTPLSSMSRMHLYTPVFDLSNVQNPVLEFDMKLDAEGSCQCYQAKTNVSYSIDGGYSWVVLDTVNESYNRWYYPMTYDDWSGTDKSFVYSNYTKLLFAGSEKSLSTFTQYNGRDVTRNTHYILDLEDLKGIQKIQFRFNTAASLNEQAYASNGVFEGLILDNFSIKERSIDLMIPYKKQLMISSLNNNIKFNVHIKNAGNYISPREVHEFYLSTDTILDNNDYFLNESTIDPLRPDMSKYTVISLTAPNNLINYKYLIFKLDADNLINESNEFNNIVYWELALDSIKTYPYVQDFSDPLLNGWYTYTTGHWGGLIQNGWRFRNVRAPGEFYNQSNANARLFTDQINSAYSSAPFWYLESPSFNFDIADSIRLSFNLEVYASTNSGANIDFSSDGGNTWHLLTQDLTTSSFNWYDNSVLSELGEPGWGGIIDPPNDSVNYNLDFLSGQQHVVFRIKLCNKNAPTGNGGLQGLYLDDFKIDARSNGITSISKKKNKNYNLYYNNSMVYLYSNHNKSIGNSNLILQNIVGETILNTPITINNGLNQYKLPTVLSSGIYFVKIFLDNTELSTKISYIKN